MSINVALMGCGSVGTQTIAQLVNIVEIDKLYLFDKDIIETRNKTHRLRLKQSIGMRKVDALKSYLVTNFSHLIQANQISTIHGDILNCQVFNTDWNGIVIDCFDNFEAREYTTKFKNVIHIGFNPIPSGLVHWNENYKVPENTYTKDPCDNQELYVFISFLASVGCMAIYNFIKSDKQDNYVVDHNFVKKIS